MKRPATKITRLANGLRVVCVEAPHLKSAYVGLVIGIGSRHEQAKDNGLSHFLEHMVFRGTRKYEDARDLNAAAESIGGALDAATYRDHTHYGTVAHPSRVDLALELLSEIVLYPKLQHIETERTIIMEEMRESFGARGQLVDVDTLAHQQHYKGHALGQPIEGTVENVERFTRRDLKRHFAACYTAPASVLVLAGNVRLAEVLPRVKRRFLRMSDRAPATTKAPNHAAKKPRLHWVNDPGAQVDLRLCFSGLAAADRDAPALNMLSRVLGEGLSSRLHSDLIDKKALAYSLSAGPEMFADCGTYDFDVAVAPEKLLVTVRELLAFANDAIAKPPTKKELTLAKERYAIGLDFMADAPADLALWTARNLQQDLDVDIDRAAERFFAVTSDDCRRVAARIFDRRTLLACGVGAISKTLRRGLERAVLLS
ncbi:MAG: insulinase family protein [Deltaproteobacteria bacterium]|nr:insulinase family protein [Deltaproteobacteria bacterium]